MSWASCAAVGTLPMSHVCASAGLARSSKIGTILNDPIRHTPVAGDLPRHNGVVGPRRPPVRRISHAQSLGRLLSRRLDDADVVGGARHDHVFAALPLPHIAEPGGRLAKRSPLELGVVPRLSAVGGYLHLANGAVAGPRQPCDLVPSVLGQLL